MLMYPFYFTHSTSLEKNLNFQTKYSCRILDCPIAFLTFIKFPEVQDRVHFPSQFAAHVLTFPGWLLQILGTFFSSVSASDANGWCQFLSSLNVRHGQLAGHVKYCITQFCEI